MTLLCVGKILSILFKLMSCQTIGDHQYVHLYFAYNRCYDLIWWLSFIALFLIIAFFMSLFVFLYKMDDMKRQSEKDNILVSLSRSYKPQYYWWEMLIFLRRLLIAFLSISFGQSNIYSHYTLICILLAFLMLQMKFKPFNMNEANELESYLLAFIIMIVVLLQIYNSNSYNESLYHFTYATIFILTLIPFMFVIGFMLSYIRKNASKITKKTTHVLLINDNGDDVYENKKRFAGTL
eukprot:330363_1